MTLLELNRSTAVGSQHHAIPLKVRFLNGATPAWLDDRYVDDGFLAGEAGPRWQARLAPARAWRRWTDRTLAQAEVIAPGGKRYLIRISRNLPLVRSPLGPFDNVVPQQISLAVLVTAYVYTRGRTGWSIQIVEPHTTWRAERVIFTRRSRVTTNVSDLAVQLADAVGRGEEPWESEHLLPFRERFRRAMNWE